MSFDVVVPPIVGGGVVERETQRASDINEREREREREREINSFILFYYILYYFNMLYVKIKIRMLGVL